MVLPSMCRSTSEDVNISILISILIQPVVFILKQAKII